MADDFSPAQSFAGSPTPEVPPLTVSPADTSLKDEDEDELDIKQEDKKPAKKRKSWGQELPVPKTNLPPRKRAKTDDEKEQRRIERVLRNRAAAQTSRERKRLEMEKLENEKLQIEQQNQLLLQRLSQMEKENNRLNQQVAQLSAEVRGSRTSTPKPASPVAEASPTLTPTLFKQEREELPMDRIPFPTPSVTDYSPTLKPSHLAESSDVTQHPAAMLCGLQCPSEHSKETEAPSPSSNWAARVQMMTIIMTWQLLFQTMTSAAYSSVILPLSQILQSLKTGSPLTFSSPQISALFPLIRWLISTPTSPSPSTASSRHPPLFRTRLLARLLACTPAMARPLRDATGRALQRAVRDSISRGTDGSVADGAGARRGDWTSLLTLNWVIDRLEDPGRRRRFFYGRQYRVGKANRSTTRRSWSSKGGTGETLTSLLMGKDV